MNDHLACHILLVKFVSGKSSQTSQDSDFGHLDSTLRNLQDIKQQLLAEKHICGWCKIICHGDSFSGQLKALLQQLAQESSLKHVVMEQPPL